MLYIPAEVFSRDTHAKILAVMVVKPLQVFQRDGLHFRVRRGWKQLPGVEMVGDFPKNPGISLRGPADHDAISAGVAHDLCSLLGSGDVAIGNDGDAHGVIELCYGVEFQFAFQPSGARSSMNGQGLNATVLRDAGNGEAIALVGGPAGADLQGDRYIHRRHHGA